MRYPVNIYIFGISHFSGLMAMNKDQNNKKVRHSSTVSWLFPCTAILFICLMLFITQLVNYINARSKSEIREPSQAPASSNQLHSGDEHLSVKTCLYVTSTEEDLYIVVRNEDGYAIEGETFTLDVLYPNGSIFTYDSDRDGSCYLQNLPSGEYRISMRGDGGYIPSEPLSIQVKSHSEHVYMISGTPVIDENGRCTFSYSFETDENGYLLYSRTREPSDVILINNKISGEVYGLRIISPDSFIDDKSLALHCERIELIYPDNTINSIYAIDAVPAERQEGQRDGWQLLDGNICYIDSSGRKLTGLRSIGGKIYFFDDNGFKAQSLGIDVSSYNGCVNWEAAKAQGIDFAILRVGGRGWTSGKTYDDSFFYNYMKDARKVGIKLGLYFYSTAITPDEAVKEANFTLKRLAEMPLDLPIYFDSEYSGEYPYGRADLLSKGQRTDIARAFCETIERAGYEAGVYASQNFWGTTLDYLPVSQYSVWLANYTRDLSLPTFFYDYNMWQFTESGHVNGFTGGVDMNVVF